jgi:hypothetical protein
MGGMSAPLPVRPNLSDPRLVALYGYWEAKRAGRSMPTRADIDPLEMKPWLGNLLLIDVIDEGRFTYRLYGTGFVNSFGRDMTGRSVDELPPEQQERVRADYQSVCASRQPRARLYTAAFEVPDPGVSSRQQTEVVTWERLVLPLSDGNAEVTMLLVGAYPLADLKPSTE